MAEDIGASMKNINRMRGNSSQQFKNLAFSQQVYQDKK